MCCAIQGAQNRGALLRQTILRLKKAGVDPLNIHHLKRPHSRFDPGCRPCYNLAVLPFPLAENVV
jgi:hypothetical protein